MPKGWSRVVRETPKTAPGQAEEREAGTNRDCEARRQNLGPGERQRLGLQPGGQV